MRPTHISIIGRSKHTFVRELQGYLREDRLSGLIKRVDAGANIVLADGVQTADDTEPLIAFLVRNGIPRSDVRLRYPQEGGNAILARALAGGLSSSKLTFGADVAERDHDLARYFVTTESFLAVKQHDKHVVVGPKGSGKSAILRELSAATPQSLVVTPEHYATDILQALKHSGLPNELLAFIATWKYTLLVEIFRRLVHLQTGDAAAISELRKYLVAHGHLAGDMTLFERFVGYLKRITQVKGKLGPVEAQIGAEGIDQLNKLFKMDELLGLIPSLQRALRRTVFTVYIDELDQSWDNSDTANQFLISLLTAAIQLRGLAENLHVVVFLRSEIFDLLKPHLPQLDKLRSDIEVLQWSKRELGNLIVSRALDSLRIAEKVPAETALRLIFSGIVEPAGVGAFEYALSRTSFRPREVIQFCNLALKAAKRTEAMAIDTDSLLRAEEEFSIWKAEHLVAENKFSVPGLKDLLEGFRGTARQQTFDSLDGLIAELLLQAGEAKNPPLWYADHLEPLQVMETLYRAEIMGLEKVASRRKDDNRPWEAYDFVFNRPQGKIEKSASFLFHPGLWSALELM